MIRLNDDERRRYEQAASDAGMSLAAWLRQAADRAAGAGHKAMLDVLRECEWMQHDDPNMWSVVWHECPVCCNSKDDGHEDDCALAALLRGSSLAGRPRKGEAA